MNQNRSWRSLPTVRDDMRNTNIQCHSERMLGISFKWRKDIKTPIICEDMQKKAQMRT